MVLFRRFQTHGHGTLHLGGEAGGAAVPAAQPACGVPLDHTHHSVQHPGPGGGGPHLHAPRDPGRGPSGPPRPDGGHGPRGQAEVGRRLG